MKRFFVQSFGCRASQADGAGIQAAFEAQGLIAVAAANQADLIVLNTCTVTANADSDARQSVRRAHRENPSAKIAVTGCFAQRAPREIAAIEGVTWVVGNSHKTDIAQIVLDAGPRSELYHGAVTASREDLEASTDMSGGAGKIFVGDFERSTEFLAAPVTDAYGDRTRPNLKVQDGCSNKCSFCIIPSVRGRSRSAPVASIVAQMNDLASRYAEIVLSGINLGRWGRDLTGQLRFVDLLRILLRETAVRRLRISSVEPMDWSEDLLQLFADEPRIARHVHLPLQSGSDSVLKRMFRKYRVRHYASRVERARTLMPDAAVGADVMTGFPGETDAEFNETVRFIEDQPFTYLHVFTYSERPGTPAALFEQQVSADLRKERTHILRDLSDRKHREFLQTMIGRSVSAVTLPEQNALTTNFLRVKMTEARPANQIVDIPVGRLCGSALKERELLPILGR